MKPLSVFLSLLALDRVFWASHIPWVVFGRLELVGGVFFLCLSIGSGLVCFSVLSVGFDRITNNQEPLSTGIQRILIAFIVASAIVCVVLLPWHSWAAALCCLCILVAIAGCFLFGTRKGAARSSQRLTSPLSRGIVARLRIIALLVLLPLISLPVVVVVSVFASQMYFGSRVESVSIPPEQLADQGARYFWSGEPFKNLPFKVALVESGQSRIYFEKGAGRADRVKGVLSNPQVGKPSS